MLSCLGTVLWPSWGHLGVILGSSWPPWAIFGSSWAILEPYRGGLGHLRPSQVHLGDLEAPSWAILEPCLDHFGAILGRVGAKLRRAWVVSQRVGNSNR
jgi:hypothetical protein